MGAKRSAEMIKALKLITEKGFSAADAAKKMGLTQSAISQTAEYKAHRAAQKAAQQ
jgi:predicted transcriptional regulator